MVEAVTNRIFHPDGSPKHNGQAMKPQDVLSNLAQVLAARANPTANVKSAKLGIRNLHSRMIPPHSPASFLQEFMKVVRVLPQSDFGGTWRTLHDGQRVLLVEFDRMIKNENVSIDLNLSDKPGAQAVLEKVQQGLGVIPAEYKALVTETVVKALQDNPAARKSFEDLIRFAKASTAILAEAKAANLSEADTAKLTNLLKQAQPFEGVVGVLVANTFDAAKNLDIKALMGIFTDYAKSVDSIVDPLVAKHMPTDLSDNPLQVSEQVQAPIQNMLSEYAAELAPVAQQVMDKTLGFVKDNAGPLANVAANVFALLSALVEKLRPTPVAQLSDLLNIPKEQVAKASLN